MRLYERSIGVEVLDIEGMNGMNVRVDMWADSFHETADLSTYIEQHVPA